MAYTENVALEIFGEGGWREDGSDAAKVDANMAKLDTYAGQVSAAIQVLQAVTGTTDKIDGGTF